MQSTPIPAAKCGWRVREWSDAVGLSRSYTYELLAANRIHSVKIGTARLITTPPATFIASLTAEAE